MIKILFALLAAGVLASCASRTMDSVPTVAELESYERVVKARYQGAYAELERRRASGRISQEDYLQEKRYLDSTVNSEVNDAAWKKHSLAESERKADGVPTPDAPVALNSHTPVAGSFYQPMNQNYGQVMGQGGSAGLGSMRAAQEQFSNARTTRNDAMSAGGSYLSRPRAGSVYDDENEQ